MNADQENSVSSFSAVDDVFKKFVLVWTPVVAFAAGVTKFRSGLAKIKSLIQTQSSSTKGITREKRSALEAMVRASVTVAGCVHAYAFDQGNEALLAKTDYSETDLYRLRDGEVGPVCQGIHDEANALAVSLVDYGLSAPMLTDQQDKIEAYDGNVAKPRSATSSKKSATTTLESEIGSVRDLLDNKMDQMVAGLKTSQPDFFNEYNTARIVVDQPGGHKGKNGNGNGSGGSDTPPTR
jgi:hypothetical protein